MDGITGVITHVVCENPDGLFPQGNLLFSSLKWTSIGVNSSISCFYNLPYSFHERRNHLAGSMRLKKFYNSIHEAMLNGKWGHSPEVESLKTWHVSLWWFECPLWKLYWYEKRTEHHWSLEKCKSKPQWDTISYQSEWLLKSQKIVDLGEVVEKRECLDIAGGSIN